MSVPHHGRQRALLRDPGEVDLQGHHRRPVQVGRGGRGGGGWGAALRPPAPARLGPRALPCSEFMVEEHELRKEKIQEDYNDKYWEQRYTVVQRHIPSFLQKMAGKVLSTGERRPRAPPHARSPHSSQRPAPPWTPARGPPH